MRAVIQLRQTFPQLFSRLVISRNFALQKKNNKPKKKKPRLTKEQRKMKEEGNQIYKNYFEKARAITQLWTEERHSANKAALDVEGQVQKELASEKERDIQILAEINMENERIASMRHQLQENKEQVYERKRLRRDRMLDNRNRRLLERRATLVKAAIEESKNFVTLDNLNDKIKECLGSEVNYNFALMPSGEKVYSTKPPGNFGEAWQLPGPIAYEVTQTQPVGGEWDWVFDKRGQWQSRQAHSESSSSDSETSDSESSSDEFEDLFDFDDKASVKKRSSGFSMDMLREDVVEKDTAMWNDQSLDDEFLDALKEKSDEQDTKELDLLDSLRDEVEDESEKDESDEFLGLLQDEEQDVESSKDEHDEFWDIRDDVIHTRKEEPVDGKEDDLLDMLRDDETDDENTKKVNKEFFDMLKEEPVDGKGSEEDNLLDMLDETDSKSVKETGEGWGDFKSEPADDEKEKKGQGKGLLNALKENNDEKEK